MSSFLQNTLSLRYRSANICDALAQDPVLTFLDLGNINKSSIQDSFQSNNCVENKNKYTVTSENIGCD